jgi:hypothetical protein
LVGPHELDRSIHLLSVPRKEFRTVDYPSLARD